MIDLCFHRRLELSFQNMGHMTPITNISIIPATNTIITTPQSVLTYTPSEMLRKPQIQTDLSITKPASSTLVDLLKQRRSPPPSRINRISSATTTTAHTQKPNSTIKQPKKPTKRTHAQMKASSTNGTNHLQVNDQLLNIIFNYLSLEYPSEQRNNLKTSPTSKKQNTTYCIPFRI